LQERFFVAKSLERGELSLNYLGFRTIEIRIQTDRQGEVSLLIKKV